MSEVRTHKGKQVWLASGRPATNDAAGFEGLTWVRLNGYTGGLQLKMDGSSAEVEDLALGVTLSGRGMDSGVASEITFRRIASDDGQTLVGTITATCSGAASVKVISAACGSAPATGDPVEYAQGYLMGAGGNEIAGSEAVLGMVTFKQELPSVAATQPA